jgi:hypothetical protein
VCRASPATVAVTAYRSSTKNENSYAIQILWLLNPLQANVGYYGDSVAIQVFTLKRSPSLGNPAFQHE